MIKEVIGNILNPKGFGPDIIIHCSNLFCTFGAGIAAQIKEKYPEAYDADCKTKKGDITKLGNYTFGDVRKNKNRGVIGPSYIVNLYAMRTLGKEGNNTCYTSFYDGMFKFRTYLEKRRKEAPKFIDLTIGMPAYIACGLSGGSPKIIHAIIDDIWESSPIIVYLYKLP